MDKTALIISTLDTKGDETLYLKEKLESIGLGTRVMDIAMGGEGTFVADIPSDMVAQVCGSSIEEIRRSKDRTRNTQWITKGASKIAQTLLTEQKIDAVIGIGGSTGSLMATDVMRSLPFGFPKVMVSSTAALPGLSTRYIGTGDIVLFHSVIEISGVSDMLKNVLDRSAHALAGMLQEDITPGRTGKGKAIALTMLGPCEKCASWVRKGLEEEGFQVIGFSAAGVCDRAMEEMIADGFFQGVIDLAPGGVGEHLFGFMRDAGPNRMESAGKAGIPQVISTCSVNHMTPAKSKYKPEYYQRPKYDLDKFRSWIRLTTQELEAVASAFAEKLNNAKGPTIVVIPTNGWSAADAPGNTTYNPKEDRVFNQALRRRLKKEISLLEVDANMEDPEFAAKIVCAFLDISNRPSGILL